ncbi:EAL domain-containing protein [Clostridium sp. AM58-1XD]|uniref:EAL domain-containing protein n=1 Tax=Clostridium sp. AM58-1XD TaxID=2292307 RepID=UPI000E511E7C|nr:EAL domain-containing protein [Clostridium sp. AM58-1XD]RGY99686.1 EAL domain-containing protein [Clostridium sp. AM58-1XD]
MGRCADNEEAGIYVIDDQYHVVSFNKKVQAIFARLKKGDVCYRVFCDEEEPCRGCPLERRETESVMFYNKIMQKWLEVDSGNIEWPGSGSCTVIMVKEIREGNKNLFYNLTNISVYDELFELNLTKNTYRILYHINGKYVIPEVEGALDQMMRDVSDYMIHPDDREGFLAFWNLNSIFDRASMGKENQVLRGQFRKRMQTGEYCWVSQIVVPLFNERQSDHIVMCFIQDINDQKIKERKTAEQNSLLETGKDRLTGLYRRNIFFNEAEQFLKQHRGVKYCLMAIDIEHFKLFNEWYGQEEGDQFLVGIGRQLGKLQDENRGIAGYMGGDDFVIILPDDKKLLNELQERIIGLVRQYGDNAGFFPAFGIYVIEEETISVSTMYDRAAIALESVKGNYAQRVCVYDSRMMKKMEENHLLLSEVQRALENREFTFYLQPQCDMTNGKIVGMESLVRWNHPKRGMIPPGDFIPILEKNGFITNLDIYVWDTVCSHVRRWIDRGRRPIPVSINVSRVDIYTLDIVECLRGLVKKYDLEPRLIEVEITESAYSEEYQIISGVIENLRKAGFLVLMDDFGSGYSSLNMLKDVNVDVLKIDMKFLNMTEQSAGKGVGILETITSMARFMGLKLIAEGVETKEQMDFLVNMGCLYGQGYYLHRPMPIDMCEAILEDESNIDFRGIRGKIIDRLRIKELLNDDIFSETMMNNILGGIGLYEACGREIKLLRVNEQYYKVTGMNPVDLEEGKKNILEAVYQEDYGTILHIFSEAYRNQLKGAEGDVRRYKGDGSVVWIHFRAFFLREQDGRKLYYGSISDVSEQKQKEKRLEASQRALAAVVNVSNKDRAFMRLTEENRRAAAAIFAQMSPGGMIGGYCEDGFPLYFANYEMVKLLGYDSYEELEQAIDGKVINTIHPDDREQVARDIGPEYYPGLEYTTTYRMPKKDGTWFWSLDKGKIVQAEDGRLAIVSACTDISEPMMARQQLAERNALLTEKNQELYFLNNDMPGGYHRCARTPDYDFTYISSRFLEIFGYTRKEITEIFGDKFMNMVHPDDRKKVDMGVEYLKENGSGYSIEYRMMSKKGYIWVVDQSQYMEYGGRTFLQGVIMDVTETVKLRNRMKVLMKEMQADKSRADKSPYRHGARLKKE